MGRGRGPGWADRREQLGGCSGGSGRVGDQRVGLLVGGRGWGACAALSAPRNAEARAPAPLPALLSPGAAACRSSAPRQSAVLRPSDPPLLNSPCLGPPLSGLRTGGNALGRRSVCQGLINVSCSSPLARHRLTLFSPLGPHSPTHVTLHGSTWRAPVLRCNLVYSCWLHAEASHQLGRQLLNRPRLQLACGPCVPHAESALTQKWKCSRSIARVEYDRKRGTERERARARERGHGGAKERRVQSSATTPLNEPAASLRK